VHVGRLGRFIRGQARPGPSGLALNGSLSESVARFAGWSHRPRSCPHPTPAVAETPRKARLRSPVP